MSILIIKTSVKIHYKNKSNLQGYCVVPKKLHVWYTTVQCDKLIYVEMLTADLFDNTSVGERQTSADGTPDHVLH